MVKKESSPRSRMPLYYCFFGKMKDNNIEAVLSTDAGRYFGLKSRSSVTRDILKIFKDTRSPGTCNYGYNVKYTYEKLREMMGNPDMKGCVLGPDLPVFHNQTIINRGFDVIGQFDSWNAETETFIADNDIGFMIITRHDPEMQIPSNIKFIINLSGETIEAGETECKEIKFDEILSDSFDIAMHPEERTGM